MITQLVKFTSALPEQEALTAARRRMPEYRAVPGLIQKIYLKFGEPDTYGGLMIWESPEALAAFRATELSRSVAETYSVVGVPEVMIGETLWLLREHAEVVPA